MAKGGGSSWAWAIIEWGPGNVDADPLFNDAGNGDYHLTAMSALVDSGDPVIIDPVDPGSLPEAPVFK